MTRCLLDIDLIVVIGLIVVIDLEVAAVTEAIAAMYRTVVTVLHRHTAVIVHHHIVAMEVIVIIVIMLRIAIHRIIVRQMKQGLFPIHL